MAWATVLGASHPFQGPGREGGPVLGANVPGKQVGSVPLGTLTLSDRGSASALRGPFRASGTTYQRSSCLGKGNWFGGGGGVAMNVFWN